MNSFDDFNKKMEMYKRLSNPDYRRKLNDTLHTISTPSYQQSLNNIAHVQATTDFQQKMSDLMKGATKFQELTNSQQKMGDLISADPKPNFFKVFNNISQVQAMPDFHKRMSDLMSNATKPNIFETFNSLSQVQATPDFHKRMNDLIHGNESTKFKLLEVNEQILSTTKLINNISSNYKSYIQKALNTDSILNDYQNVIKNIDKFQVLKDMPKPNFSVEAKNTILSFNRVIEKNLYPVNLTSFLSEINELEIDFDEIEENSEFENPLFYSLWELFKEQYALLGKGVNAINTTTVMQTVSLISTLGTIFGFASGVFELGDTESESNSEEIEQINEAILEEDVKKIELRSVNGEITEVEYYFIEEDENQNNES